MRNDGLSRRCHQETLMGGSFPSSRKLHTGTNFWRACLSVLLGILVILHPVTCQSTSSQVPILPSRVATTSSSQRSFSVEPSRDSMPVQPTRTLGWDSSAPSGAAMSASSTRDFFLESSSSATWTSGVGSTATPAMPSLDWMVSTLMDTTTISPSSSSSSSSQTVAANASETLGTSLSNTLQLCCDMSSVLSILPTLAVPGASSVALNGTGGGGVTNPQMPGSHSPLTTTPGLVGNGTTLGMGGAGNSSCSGNNTGCPEYNGKQDYQLATHVIIGVACGAAALVIILVGLVIFLLRRRGQLGVTNKSESNYWDDNVTLSYINGHMDLPRDFADEMISLDNDSFLNSLDNMSYTNYPSTNGTRHTVF